jgi:deoxycytidine triphosphate deaminase
MLEWVFSVGYNKLSNLLLEHTGHTILSDGGIKKYILRKSVTISELWDSKRVKTEENSLKIAVQEDINVYDREAGEVILMMDDVGVKAQKPHKKVERTK